MHEHTLTNASYICDAATDSPLAKPIDSWRDGDWPTLAGDAFDVRDA